MPHDLSITIKKIESLKEQLQRDNDYNLNYAWKRVKEDVNYKWWFFCRNVIEILALKDSESNITDDGTIYSEEGYVPYELDFLGFKYSTSNDDYGKISNVLEEIYINSNQDTAIIVENEVETNNYDASFVFHINPIFLEICKEYGVIEDYIKVKCTDCKFVAYCNHSFSECAYNIKGEVK